MAYEFYVTIEAARQGRLAGEIPRSVHKGKLAGLGFSYGVTSPRIAGSGAGTGGREHGAVTFTKEWGAASPREDVALAFRGIEIENIDGRTSASDAVGMP